jgi:putative transposase
MRDVMYLLLNLLTTIARLIKPDGSRTVIAANLLLKQQLIIHSRSRQRGPSLDTCGRALLGFMSRFLHPRRKAGAAIIKSSKVLRFYSAMNFR